MSADEWAAVLRQTGLTLSLGQIECGSTTHSPDQILAGDCQYCGAAL